MLPGHHGLCRVTETSGTTVRRQVLSTHTERVREQGRQPCVWCQGVCTDPCGLLSGALPDPSLLSSYSGLLNVLPSSCLPLYNPLCLLSKLNYITVLLRVLQWPLTAFRRKPKLLPASYKAPHDPALACLRQTLLVKSQVSCPRLLLSYEQNPRCVCGCMSSVANSTLRDPLGVRSSL